jgi:hypothetical protein
MRTFAVVLLEVLGTNAIAPIVAAALDCMVLIPLIRQTVMMWMRNAAK